MVNIRMYYNRFAANGKMLDTVSPEEFLGLVKQAAYVCTDSFHGSIFSILMEKEFFCFKRFRESAWNNQNSRIYNLLDKFELTSRLSEEHSPILMEKMNYKRIAEILKECRREAFVYLEYALAR